MRTLILASSLSAILLIPSIGAADSYDTGESDHLFRYAAYPLHAVGKGIECFVTRPVHWFVSRPCNRYIFGHVSNPRTDDYWGDKDLYQRYSY
jgi:hypothetical protein